MALSYNWRIVSRDVDGPTTWALGIEVVDSTGRQVQLKLIVSIDQDIAQPIVVDEISARVSQALVAEVGSTAEFLDRMISDKTLVPLPADR